MFTIERGKAFMSLSGSAKFGGDSASVCLVAAAASAIGTFRRPPPTPWEAEWSSDGRGQGLVFLKCRPAETVNGILTIQRNCCNLSGDSGSMIQPESSGAMH